MGIKHKAVKAFGEEGHSSEWNEEHKIDSDVDFAGHSGVNLGEPVSPSDVATKNYVDAQAGPAVMSPIGSIVSWLKNLTGTPALPDGWVECNGQTLSDADSPYNGKVIPNLNGGNRFLRGAAASGGTGGTATHFHTSPLWLGPTYLDMAPNTGDIIDGAGIPIDQRIWPISHENLSADPKPGLITNSKGTIPPYYNIVWIMRVK